MNKILNRDWGSYITDMISLVSLKITPEFVSLVLQLLAAVAITLIMHRLVSRSRHIFSSLQKRLYQSRLSRGLRNQLGSLLRLSNPNFPWLCSLFLGFIYTKYFQKAYLFDYLIVNFIFSYALFRFTLVVSTYAIEHSYSATHIFVSKSLLRNLYSGTKRFSYLLTLFSYSLFLMHSYSINTLILLLSYVFFILILIKVAFSVLKEHEKVLKKFIIKQLPHNDNNTYEKAFSLIFIAYLFLAHTLTAILIVHKNLLHIKYYQQFTAKVLWLHLDQKQQDATHTDNSDINEIIDENYGHWFRSNYEPKKITSTENITKLNESLSKITDAWLNNKSSENNILLHGCRGIGKSTLIKNWEKSANNTKKIVRTNLACRDTSEANLIKSISNSLEINIDSIDELLILDETIEKTIVVIDNCENLFLSKIGGFKAYQLILSLITMPLNNIFWVFVIGTETNKILNNIFGQSHQFSHCLEMRSWQSEEIREMIMSRHNSSRRRLIFDELLFSSIGNDEYSSYASAADRCFLLLAEQSNGNPSIAIEAWFKASSKKDAYTIEIGLPEKANMAFLSQCSSDLLFIYAALIKHKQLSLKDAYQSTRQEESVALRAFKFGIDQGFLHKNERNEFSVHAYWHFQLISFLTSKNYLTRL